MMELFRWAMTRVVSALLVMGVAAGAVDRLAARGVVDREEVEGLHFQNNPTDNREMSCLG